MKVIEELQKMIMEKYGKRDVRYGGKKSAKERAWRAFDVLRSMFEENKKEE